VFSSSTYCFGTEEILALQHLGQPLLPAHQSYKLADSNHSCSLAFPSHRFGSLAVCHKTVAAFGSSSSSSTLSFLASPAISRSWSNLRTSHDPKDLPAKHSIISRVFFQGQHAAAAADDALRIEAGRERWCGLHIITVMRLRE
jgi:hypothetical protein